MTDTAPRIAVIIPCYKVEEQVLEVLARVPASVWRIYCIDDACPNGSGKLIEAKCADKRVKVLYNEKNQGVGGAVKAGYFAAWRDGCAVAVKIDGDGQMDPTLIDRFVAPLLSGRCDYTKGNRFFYLEDVKDMPAIRLIGNAALSFLSKLSSGYWQLFDPANGYTDTEGGTGLGLAIVQSMASAHGWSVSIDDSETGGARFVVTGASTVIEDGDGSPQYSLEGPQPDSAIGE
jgi:glycosyltransferase involved in cell wall biosynthesis